MRSGSAHGLVMPIALATTLWAFPSHPTAQVPVIASPGASQCAGQFKDLAGHDATRGLLREGASSGGSRSVAAAGRGRSSHGPAAQVNRRRRPVTERITEVTEVADTSRVTSVTRGQASGEGDPRNWERSQGRPAPRVIINPNRRRNNRILLA